MNTKARPVPFAQVSAERFIQRSCGGWFLLVLFALAVPQCAAAAGWSPNPYTGDLPVCTTPSFQSQPTIAPDGAGGALVVWYDGRGSDGYDDIYAQRISPAGVPLWGTDGVLVCGAPIEQYYPTVVSDGAGGAFITWADYRSNTNGDIYAQRISAAGVPQWKPDGVALCIAPGDQTFPTIVADAAGGAIVTWSDGRGASTDIYAQRVSGAGVPQWAPNGVALCAASGNQEYPVVVTDGAGGAIVTWTDYRNGPTSDVYSQRVTAAGVPLWTPDGVALCTAPGYQPTPRSVADGVGGAIVSWYDGRVPAYDIYAQRISAAGVPQWTANGVPLCTAPGAQLSQSIASDGGGGAIVVWQDFRSSVSFEIYAQRVSSAGLPLWTPDGVPVSLGSRNHIAPSVVADGAGGAIFSWQDFRSGTDNDIYAQRLGADGLIKWSEDGVALCTAPNSQYDPVLATDGAGGAIAAWEDDRLGLSSDIYAQHVERYGQLGNPEPVITRVKDVPNDEGGRVKLSWNASYLDSQPYYYYVLEYRVYRSVPISLATSAGLQQAITTNSDIAVRDGALLATESATSTLYWEYLSAEPAEGFAGYSMTVQTTSDSTANSNLRTLFMVEARSNTLPNSPRWFSAPDSGYSVDNLPPIPPQGFSASYDGTAEHLHWSRGSEADLAGYRLYRGSDATFSPGATNLVATVADTGYADVAGASFVYKLTAVDSHGNESPAVTLQADASAGTGPPIASELEFASPSPNPAIRSAAMRFSLPTSGHVRVAIFDAQGRIARVLADGAFEPGLHELTWDLRDDNGGIVRAGLYFARVGSDRRAIVRRLVVTP